jgi:hypothetical protein
MACQPFWARRSYLYDDRSRELERYFRAAVMLSLDSAASVASRTKSATTPRRSASRQAIASLAGAKSVTGMHLTPGLE